MRTDTVMRDRVPGGARPLHQRLHKHRPGSPAAWAAPAGVLVNLLSARAFGSGRSSRSSRSEETGRLVLRFASTMSPVSRRC